MFGNLGTLRLEYIPRILPEARYKERWIDDDDDNLLPTVKKPSLLEVTSAISVYDILTKQKTIKCQQYSRLLPVSSLGHYLNSW